MARGRRGQRQQMGSAEFEALLGFYAPDVVCYPAAGWVDYEVCHGHEGMRELTAPWLQRVDHFAVKVHEVRDLQERLLVLAEFTGRAKDTGEPVSQPFGLINSELGEGGKVGVVHFFLSWEETRRAAAAGADQRRPSETKIDTGAR